MWLLLRARRTWLQALLPRILRNGTSTSAIFASAPTLPQGCVTQTQLVSVGVNGDCGCGSQLLAVSQFRWPLRSIRFDGELILSPASAVSGNGVYVRDTCAGAAQHRGLRAANVFGIAEHKQWFVRANAR